MMVKKLITHAMSYWLGKMVGNEEAEKLMKTMGLTYIETEEIPESDGATLTLITTKKLISSAIDYHPIHRSSHIVRPPDFDSLLEILQKSGKLRIGGVPGVGKTTLAYLLLSRLPKPYWLLRVKADIEIPVDLIDRLTLMTDTPLLLFCDRDIDTCGEIPKNLPHLFLGEGTEQMTSYSTLWHGLVCVTVHTPWRCCSRFWHCNFFLFLMLFDR